MGALAIYGVETRTIVRVHHIALDLTAPVVIPLQHLHHIVIKIYMFIKLIHFF